MNLKEAKEWFASEHDRIGQTRADGSPYKKHTQRVAATVSEEFDGEPDHNMVVKAAHGHDWYEDVSQDYDLLVKNVGRDVANLIVEVSNEYTKEKYPDWNRKKRKEHETKRLGKISFNAKMIKLSDIIDNVGGPDKKGTSFYRKMYAEEKLAVLDAMVEDMPYLTVNDLYKQARLIVESVLR